MKRKRLSALLLAACMVGTLLTGCGGEKTSSAAPADTTSAAAPEADTAQTAAVASAAEEETSVPTEEAAADGWVYTPISYPLEDGGTLSYYMIKDLSQKSVLGSWQEHPMLKVIREKTGVTLDITAVSQTNGTDMMNLMLASGDFTDLIESLTYATGFASAMDDDIVREIGDLLEDYAPDYNKLLVENPDYKKSITSDDGRIGIFATITQGSRGPSDGLMINQDWLDECGLETPVTFDDLEETLLTFKDKYNLTDPLYMVGDGILDYDQLSGAFDVALKFNSITGQGGFYIDDNGEIQFGYTQEGYKDYVTKMHDWYEKGILSSDFVSHTTDYMNDDLIEDIISKTTGVFSRGDGLIDMLRNVSGSNLVALADPVLEEGQTIHLGNQPALPSTVRGVVITTACEEPEMAAEFLNWWYTDDGFLASSYGQEGVSYTMVDGKPQYTEMMTNTEGTTLSAQKLDNCGPLELLIDGTTPEASYSQIAQDAPLVWGTNKDGAYNIPEAVEMTSDEGDEFNTYFSDISTLCRQYTVQFITGTKDLSEVDAFQEQLEGMGVDTCCEIYQDAYDRYNNR